MPRPSQNTDRELLMAARDLIPVTGCTGLSIRQVAKKAGVNLGMFHYHFKTKKQFVRVVLQEVYEEFFKEMSVKAHVGGDSKNRLRNALVVLGKFSRNNRGLLMSLIRDMLNGDKEVTKFIRENFSRHFILILGLIRECKKERKFHDYPEVMILIFLVGVVGIPHLVVELLTRSKLTHSSGVKKLAIEKFVLSDNALEQRIDLVLRAVSKGMG